MAGLERVTVELPYRPPYDWRAMIGFLGPRAIPGVEAVDPGAYRRTFATARSQGIVEVRPGVNGPHLVADVWTSDSGDLEAVAARLRRLFDLDADVAAIDAHLAADPILAERIRERPGIRVPGAWDPFELAVRAVLGQQITVAAATTVAGRLAASFGEQTDAGQRTGTAALRLLFPLPAAVAAADLGSIGLTRARAAALRGLAAALVDNPRLLKVRANLDSAVRRLQALPGIGPWTAHYIAMRALREPDAFPATDLGLLRAFARFVERPKAAQLLATAEPWRPWRSYAAMRLWLQPAG